MVGSLHDKALFKENADKPLTLIWIILRSDFMHAMENDIKPAFGAAAEVL